VREWGDTKMMKKKEEVILKSRGENCDNGGRECDE